MNLKDAAIGYWLQPRLLHRLPGRVRIHLPVLKRLGKDNPGVVAFVTRLLSVPPGLSEVAPCPITGNVLIRFDGERLKAEDVVRFVRAAARLCLANQDKLGKVPVDRLPEIEDRLAAWLKERITYRLEFDGDLRIPEDVLA